MRDQIKQFLTGNKPSFPMVPAPTVGKPEFTSIKFKNFDELVTGLATLATTISTSKGIPIVEVVPVLSDATQNNRVPPRVHLGLYVELARREKIAEDAGAKRDEGGILADIIDWAARPKEKGGQGACACVHCMMRNAAKVVVLDGKTFDEAMAETLALFMPTIEGNLKRTKEAFEKIFTRTNDETVIPREAGKECHMDAGFASIFDENPNGPMQIPPLTPPSLEGE
jgi:hypothetical protein